VSSELLGGDDVQDREDRIAALERENRELREKIEQMNKRMVDRTTVNNLIAALAGSDVTDFTADPMQHRSLLTDVQDRLSAVDNRSKQNASQLEAVYDGNADGPEQAWLETAAAARNLQDHHEHGLPDNRVKLYKENIAQATGRTERMAGNYIEAFGENKEGTEWIPYERPTAGSAGNGRKKALIVDMDVWGEDDE
jgi:hypothetical protein